MSEHRPHAATTGPSGGPTLAHRLRALLSPTDAPPLRRPSAPRLDPVHRSWLGAFWQARIAVRAAMHLDEFLRSRLGRYVAGLPVPSARLPHAISVEEGRIAVEPRPKEPAPPALAGPADPDGWLLPLVAVEGPTARQELAELEVRLAVLDGEVEASRRRAQEISRRLATDVAAGLVAAPPSIDATPEQMGRPPVRSAGPHAAMIAFVAAALAAETWQIALPLLAGAGLGPTDLAALADRPGEAAAVSAFALGIAVALFSLAHVGVDAFAGLLGGDGGATRRRWLAAATAASGLGGVLVAVAVAALRRPATAGAVPGWALVLLLLSVPTAGALVLRAARSVRETRALEASAMLAWDRERARALADRARRLEELAWAEEERRDGERRREATRRRLREVSARAIAAARIASEAERRERSALARLGQSLVAALELDRCEFVRQATVRGALELLGPPRRKAPDPRPSAFDGTATAQAPLEVETGRAAS